MAIIFLIGGTGNQFFQYAASAPEDVFSGFFLDPVVRRALKWTNHEQSLHFPWAPKSLQVLALITLALDVLLARLFGFSLFSTLDTRSLKMRPSVVELNRFGYFQDAPERRDFAELARQISPAFHKGRIVLHIRGGDLVTIDREGRNVYGMLDREYFIAALKRAKEAIPSESAGAVVRLVVTDDPDYAASLDLGSDSNEPVNIQCLPLGETLALAVGADWFVASNSTMSYWIVRLRGGKNCIAPKPFQKRWDYDLPDKTTRLAVEFE
jgi:hypothetical protein